MLQLYIDLALSRLARHAIQPIQRIQLYSYTRYTAYSTIQRPSGRDQAQHAAGGVARRMTVRTIEKARAKRM